MEVPHASGYTSCKFLALGWPIVQQLRTLGWMLLLRMRMGRRRGGSRRRGPAVMGGLVYRRRGGRRVYVYEMVAKYGNLSLYNSQITNDPTLYCSKQNEEGFWIGEDALGPRSSNVVCMGGELQSATLWLGFAGGMLMVALLMKGLGKVGYNVAVLSRWQALVAASFEGGHELMGMDVKLCALSGRTAHSTEKDRWCQRHSSASWPPSTKPSSCSIPQKLNLTLAGPAGLLLFAGVLGVSEEGHDSLGICAMLLSRLQTVVHAPNLLGILFGLFSIWGAYCSH
eukprot:872398-Pelagomonas_calceolata.AAC.1